CSRFCLLANSPVSRTLALANRNSLSSLKRWSRKRCPRRNWSRSCKPNTHCRTSGSFGTTKMFLPISSTISTRSPRSAPSKTFGGTFVPACFVHLPHLGPLSHQSLQSYRACQQTECQLCILLLQERHPSHVGRQHQQER